MNPPFHDEFVALCALYYSGEISEEEWALLQIHMGYCDDCHRKFLEYQEITSKVVPDLAVAAASQAGDLPSGYFRSVQAAEDRLMKQLESQAASEPPLVKSTNSWRSAALLLAACLMGVAILAASHLIPRQSQKPANNTAAVSTSAAEPRPKRAPATDENPELRQAKQEVAELRSQLADAGNHVKRSDTALSDAQRHLESEQGELKQIAQERDSLSEQIDAARREAQALRTKIASTDADGTQPVARVSVLEAKVRDLNAELDDRETALSEKERMLDLDAEFLAHDRDIRDLIGARNLYISDIVDMTESGKTAKQFGRIFYTKDRSLVFYGFDLDKQAGMKRDVSFQAWGSGSHQDSPVSLGLFYQDDGHKRWVLRCNDSKTLARLDMVFVTVEPSGGSSKPTGKPLLRAYLQMEPNHR